jgi:hypothetical protein
MRPCAISNSASHLNAHKILDRWGGIDVPGSIEYFKEHAGNSDCMILFNMDLQD